MKHVQFLSKQTFQVLQQTLEGFSNSKQRVQVRASPALNERDWRKIIALALKWLINNTNSRHYQRLNNKKTQRG